MSTSIFRWRFLMFSSVFILIGGIVLMVLLALGLADPPRTGPLWWETLKIADWPVSQQNEMKLYTAPVMPNEMFTLEMTALNGGPADSAWGLWIRDAERPITLLISNEGYSAFEFQWHEFPHIEAGETNRIYLHVAQNGQGTIRINDEIVADGIRVLLPIESWGIIVYRDPELKWEQIALYQE